ncbi:MAG: 30S ribosomal protein S9 [Spirochaetes bacterium GWF1_51_8]|nr:MAG: 30S ribosomal protein S9 [Spirochaetes bacterium GWF1_51_8]
MAEKIYATGRRKTSVARIFLSPKGTGKFTINGKEMTQYFPAYYHPTVLDPFKWTETLGKFDVYSTVKGGGFTGQAGAIRQGIARALSLLDAEKYRKTVKVAGFLTRDDRMVERKKVGLRKARKREQYSKR